MAAARSFDTARVTRRLRMTSMLVMLINETAHEYAAELRVAAGNARMETIRH